MKNYLKFWGTRGSCPVSGLEYSHFGGNTCCLEIRYEDKLIIIDAGTGIRPLGRTLKEEKEINLFLSHTHWDHLIGFPFFDPIFKEDVNITIWAPKGCKKNCHEVFAELLSEEFFPIDLSHIKANLKFKIIEENKPVQLGKIDLSFHHTHHPGPTYCFKIKTPHETIGYVTDNEINQLGETSFIAFHKGCDYFIHEAQYSSMEYSKKAGWGHSSLSDAMKLIREIEPVRWLVTHHDPIHTDKDLKALEVTARAENPPCPVEWIGDGYVLSLK